MARLTKEPVIPAEKCGKKPHEVIQGEVPDQNGAARLVLNAFPSK